MTLRMEHGQVVRISSAQSNAAQHLLTVICPALDIKVLPGEVEKRSILHRYLLRRVRIRVNRINYFARLSRRTRPKI